jgi:hypothetical protein
MKVYVNDVGTQIILNCGTDLSGATLLRIKVKKPNGVSVTWTALPYMTTQIAYTTILGDLDQVGVYKIQAYVETPSWKGHGETLNLTVYNNFE